MRKKLSQELMNIIIEFGHAAKYYSYKGDLVSEKEYHESKQKLIDYLEKEILGKG